jgi:hypothetical protein
VPGPLVRLTTNSTTTGNPSAAWDGTHVGVVYTEDNGSVVNLMFALLNPDGTRAKATDTVVASYAASPDGIAGVVGAPSLVWNGTEYAVAWAQTPGLGGNVAFRRLDATGATKGATVVVSDPANSVSTGPSLAWSSTYGGYAIAYTYGTLNFRRIGTDGTNPDPENKVDVISAIGFPDSRALPSLGVAPDGRWAVLLNFMYQGELLTLFNADGSRTVAPARISYAYQPGEVLWDGSAFLAAYASTDYLADNRTMSYSGEAYMYASPTPGILGAVEAELDKTVVTQVWTEAQDGVSPYDLRIRRYTLPPDATSTLTPITQTVQIVTTATIADPSAFSATRAGTTAIAAVWADDRWGAATELYYEKVDLGACP